MKIHKTAIISGKAKLAQDLEVGAYTTINDNVKIAEGTKIGAHCVIDGNTSIGTSCEILTGAVIGSCPQDLKYKGENSALIIGDNNVIREYCTFNLGTSDNGRTIV
ncbi:MAG: acyl-[acyl-carrier-protein]--UDP-N-acetylglucosamine O-acyltransferase, partial [Nitrospirota bacterium]|nr:acyl-[acyl-carrier-protein]--UDP-N-acetylglucosamine O-acyltransferase [Nitrospirota bacterium]